MRIFLVEYDRRHARLVRVEDFGHDRARADQARLSAELVALDQGWEREIVTLESESFDVLQRTHASYFRGAEDLMARFRRDLPAA